MERARISGSSITETSTPTRLSLTASNSEDVEQRIMQLSVEQNSRLTQICEKVHALELTAGMNESRPTSQQETSSATTNTIGENGRLSLNTASRASTESSKSITPGAEAKGPKSNTPTTPDPGKMPQSSLWGALGDILSPMKVTVERTYERVNKKMAKIYAQQRAESAQHSDGEGGDMSPMFEGGGRRLVLTTDGHSYEGGLNEQGQMHGYGRLTWPDSHTYQVRFPPQTFFPHANPPKISFAFL
jgi:hypothetical protein